MSCSTKEFFIGATTGSGYTSCCDDVFENAERIYIVKGAPGTGKSHLMKELSLCRSEETEIFYCSSDHRSIDALWFPKKKICITDGTSPHAKDTKIPGIRDELVDLGRFWDSEVLLESKKEIAELTKAKTEGYKRIFSSLSLLGRLKCAENEILSDYLNKEKMNAAADRLVKRIGAKKGNILFRQTLSVGMHGINSLDTFKRLSEISFDIDGRYGSGSCFCDAVLRSAKENQVEVWVSRDPLRATEPCSVFFPGSNAMVEIKNGENDDTKERSTKIINMERFIPSPRLGSSKACLKQIERTRNEFIKTVLKDFEKVRDAHFGLEKIYGRAMDFKAVTKYTKELSKTIFS